MKKQSRPIDDARYKNIVIPKLERQKKVKRDIRLQMPKIGHPKAAPSRSKEAMTTVVTVSTPFGLKSFAFGKIKKRILISFTVFTVLFLVFGSVGLFVSFSNNLMLSNLLEETKKGYSELMTRNRGLQSVVDEERAIKEKESSLANMINLRIENSGQKPLDLSSISVEQKTMLLRNIPNGSPVPHQGITSEFGSRNHPVLGRTIFHEGTDLKAGIGTKVYAAADGIVDSTKYNGGYGNVLIIRHAYGFSSVYGHLSRFASRPGDFVRKGQLIAFSGNTGLTAGPHLHYEVRFVGEALNPEPFLKWDYSNFGYLFEKERKIKWASLVEATRWQTQAEHLSSLRGQKSSDN